LIDADSETHLWSGNYDRTLEDIFAVQDEIAGHVVDALQVKLLGKEAPKMKVTTPEGYALYLQGMYFAQTVYDYTKADEYLRQSLAIDPGYAPAWSGLSMVRTNQCIAGLIGYHEGYQQSREYASRALKLDPNFGDAQSGLGWIAMMYDRDLPTAAFHFRRALALAPNDARILGNASTFAETLGRFDRAIELAERSLAIDPLSSTTYGNTAAVHCYLGQFDLAHRKFRKARELSPGDPFYRLWQAKCYLLEGEPARALEVAEQIEPESRRLWTLPMAYHDLGQEQTSDEYLNLLKEKYADEAAAFIAENHAWRGEIDQAFEWLNRAIDEKQYMWGSLVFDPAFSNLHSDARWNEIRIRDGRSEEQLKKIEF
jgi:tetratricopeptide (TPR) repeat protein